jgi:hypothetical protein
MADIQVDFNNLRRHAINEFDAVVSLIKTRAERLDDMDPDFFSALQDKLDDLRGSLATIALCHDEANGIEDVLGERTLLSLSSEEEVPE